MGLILIEYRNIIKLSNNVINEVRITVWIWFGHVKELTMKEKTSVNIARRT